MISTIDAASAVIERRYYAFLLQLTGAFSRVMEEPAPTTPHARGVFVTEAQNAQVETLTGLTVTLDHTIEQLLKGAIEGANPALSVPQRENVSGIVHEARNDVLGDVVSVSEKDISVVSKGLRQFALDVDAFMNVQRSSYTMAIVGAKMHLDTNFRFHQLDRLGRKWPSTTYLRTAIRGFLVTSYIETYLYALAARGIDMVTVKHPEPDHPHNNMALSISGTILNMPSYHDLKSEVWHPNSRAVILHA